MKIPPKPQVLAQRIEQASRKTDTRTGAIKHDPEKMAAGDEVHARAMALVEPQAPASPIARARKVWRQRGQGEIPALACRAIQEGQPAEFRKVIAGLDAKTLGLVVDDLALRVILLDGHEEALSRLLDMKVVCDAGKNLVPEYNRRIRTTPRAMGGGQELEPGLEDALGAMKDQLREVRKEVQQGTFLGRMRTRAGVVSTEVFDRGKALLSQAKGLMGAGEPGFFSDLWSKTKMLGSHLVPAPIQRGLKSIADSATTLVAAVSEVEDNLEDHAGLVDRMVSGMAAARSTIDPSADAISVGMVSEATAGLAGTSGHELVYLRESAELRVNKLDGVGVRIGVGGAVRAFISNSYGTPKALRGSCKRRVLEFGAVVANLSINRGGGGDAGGVSGFSTTFGIGMTASLPFLDGQAFMSMTEEPLLTIDLSQAQIDQLEAEISQVSAGSQRWTGLMRRLAKKKSIPEE